MERELIKLIVATKTGDGWVGKGERGRSIVEAGMRDIKGEVDLIRGWGMIWVEDPWTGKWQKVRVPREEADYRRRGLPQCPSYWGELEAREWRRRLREEKEVVDQEERECRVWHLEEAQRRGSLTDRGALYEERKTFMGWRCEKKRPPHYPFLKGPWDELSCNPFVKDV